MEDWRPSASHDLLRRRALLLARIREFFRVRGVLEVDTPILCAAGSTDPHLQSFVTRYRGPRFPGGRSLYLQTSPELAMKRLLAAGSGAIYQICKAFRDGEAGRWHNPEFTLLEWYRPGFDHHALIDEVLSLIRELLGDIGGERVTYAQVLSRFAGVDPHDATSAQLRECALDHGIGPVPGLDTEDRDAWLDLLLTHLVVPGLSTLARAVVVYDYPASQAALARVRPDSPPVAERFELYLDGVELANGFHELADAAEQRRRFERDRAWRRRVGAPDVTPDERLLAALASGLPDCAGVALGVDRLLMAVVGAATIDEVLAFPLARA